MPSNNQRYNELEFSPTFGTLQGRRESMMYMDYVNLNSFLDFGYFLKYDNAQKLIDYTSADPGSLKNLSHRELLTMGCDLFQKAIDEQYVPGSEGCVPLSGGIDSRAILGGLLKCTEAKNIHTYTFGVPGAWDFEFGKIVAESVGTKHTQIDLNDYKYTQDELLEISRRVEMQTMLFLHPPLYILKRYESMSIWTGAVIDVLFGRHDHSQKSETFDDAVANFFSSNVFVKSCNLINVERDQYKTYVCGQGVELAGFPKEHVIDLENRQNKYVWRHVCMKGFNYKTLLTCKDLISFALSLDPIYLKGQSLYKEMVLNLYGDLFGLPCSRSAGLPLKASRQSVFLMRAYRHLRRKLGAKDLTRVNYMDFNQAILKNESMRKVVVSNINDLVSRNLITWIDPLKILDDHLNGKGQYADALLVLTSLEIHLKNGREI